MNPPSGLLAVRAVAPEYEARASFLADQLQLEASDSQGDLILQVGDHLALAIENSRQHPLHIDFASAKLNWRRQHGGGLSQPLAKAAGLKSLLKQFEEPWIVDGTAGLGRDAFMLANWGCRVTMVEQSQVLAWMLEEALARADLSVADVCGRMSLVHGHAENVLAQLAEVPQVIYLDPMFPDVGRSASVKGELQILQRLHGVKVEQQEADQALLRTARQFQHCRVVVKRPSHAPLLSADAPTYQIKGRTTRFDVYVS